jgi:hypothetical protein
MTATRFSLGGSASASITSRFFHASQSAHAKLNVEGLASRVDLKGVNVLMRVDLNVPLAKVRTVLSYVHHYIRACFLTSTM